MNAYPLALFRAVVLLAIAGCSRGDADERNARARAELRFAQLCEESHLQPAEFDGPVRTEVGGADFAYEWKSKRKGQAGVLISVTKDQVEPTFLDDEESAAAHSPGTDD